MSEDGSALRRYHRPHESPPPAGPPAGDVIPSEAVDAACAASTLSAGSRDLVRGLLAVGRPAVFGGGGAGIEYGALLKTAARPEYLAAHVREAAAHLREREVDLLVVPGMSGYPVGAMYSIVSGIPAVLLKKQKHAPQPSSTGSVRYPPGSFVIPSYTGEGDVVMSADLDALQDMVDGVVARQLDARPYAGDPEVTLRVAGADDIIDKATMSQAVSESALVLGKLALERAIARHRKQCGDIRPIRSAVEVVAWVTPLIKGYNRPREAMARWFGIEPFAGLIITSIHLDPPAIGIEGLGIVGFSPRRP